MPNALTKVTGNVIDSATNITIGIGSTSGPSLSPNGDSNTGIFFPSADTIAFAEGGTEVARIDSSGRFGIGTASAASYSTYGNKLVVYGTGTDGPGMTIATGTSDTGSIYFADGTTGDQVARGAVQYAHASDALLFQTAATERFRCDSSGRLLLGTPSANGNYTLQIQGDAAASTSFGSIYLRRGLATANIGANVGAGLGQIVFGANDGTTAALIECTSDATWSSTSDTPGRLIFSTTADGASSPTEQMRIDSAGRVVIGEYANNDCLVTIRPKATNPSYNLYCDAIAQYSALYRFVRFRVTASNTIVGSIESNGTSTTYATTSDYRLKENVTKISNATSRLQQLKPSRFNFIADPDRIVDGFIAHEVQTVVPEAIVGTKDEKDTDGNPVYQGIDQSKLVPLLTAALQEAITKIETLEATNADLLARVTALESA